MKTPAPFRRLPGIGTLLEWIVIAIWGADRTQAAASPEQICNAIRKPDYTLALREQSALGQKGPLELVRSGVRLNVADEFLFARLTRVEPDDAISVKQVDGGEISGLFEDGGGAVLVIGTRDSYRVVLSVAEGRARLAPVQRLPHIYRERCGFWTHLVDACQRSAAVYSAELRAVLMSGFDRQAQGQSWAYGLDASPQPRALTGQQGDFLQYMYDVTGTGSAVFKGSRTGRLYLFDGRKTTDCNT